ncbi:MAG: hypothetical protein M1833_004706 [Piccolia ochrophora]|nr:MAG: hypothetical protein M1833_004706 [Piccolia ochrophora]
MWESHPNQMYEQRAEQDDRNVRLHNVDDTGERPHEPSEAPGQDTTVNGGSTSGKGSHDSGEVSPQHIGPWGERDVGGPVDVRTALEDFEQLRQTLSRVSTQRSRSHSRSSRRPSLWQRATGTSRARRQSTRASRVRTRRTTTRGTANQSELSEVDTAESDIDAEAAEEEAGEAEEEFQLGDFLREGHFEHRVDGKSAKKVGVIFKNLTVKGVGSTTAFAKTLPQAIAGTFGPDLYHLLCRFFPFLIFGKGPATRNLINDFTGVVKNGEMMLVLGRPGSGCSTFLRAVANNRTGFAAVTGDVSYGGISAEQQGKTFRGEVNYNEEDDQHFPNLNVWQTLAFALLNKTRKHERDSLPILINALMKMFGITHTGKTLVGNEFVPGISGGERKRVSIAETLATKSTVVCWDNSTRGLDASTALDYANSLRVMTDISDRTTLVTLYQAGEGIYELMDKVMVIDQGKMIYQGPAREAKQYFVDLGFFCPERETTADFLTSVADPNERSFREGHEDSAPKTAAELESAFRKSPNYQRILKDVQDYENFVDTTDKADARQFQDTVQKSKSKTVFKDSSYTVSFFRQVLTCTRREFWLIWGDPVTLKTKFFIIIANGLIVGSLFYGQPENTDGAFPRGGTLFFSILFLGWLQLSELMKAVSGRSVISRHREYAFYRPSAVVISRVITDLPMLLVQVIIFTIIMYFLTGLDQDPAKYFIYVLFVYTTTICITALYRMFAAMSPTIDDAVRFSGIGLNLLIVYTGYVIPKPQLVSEYIWFGWIYYINPLSYAFEAVMANEFSDRTLNCATSATVPQGPGFNDSRYQGCAIAGAEVGNTAVSGSRYLDTQFTYRRHHLWRNFGVIIAFTVLYILVTAVASEVFTFVGGGGGSLLFKSSKRAKRVVKSGGSDEEKVIDPSEGSDSDRLESVTTDPQKHDDALKLISASQSVFTWKNVEYTVPYGSGQRKLLNSVNGYAKPGFLVALVGASGAGKTTLLNTLSRRHKMGVVGGEMLVDGRGLGLEFQRGTGFCEQMDLHDGTQTIREALEFSAILRQERTVSRKEKLAYVDTIIDLLELGDIQDALVMSLGVEQRKRLTIGVELAAKPNLLLFLDEPTSGLDSQSAFSIVRFLRKLSRAGQAIVCTIHQPSSILIQQFDTILALNPGGNTFYWGPVGENGSAVIEYFAKRGVKCPPGKNVAEFILETAAKGGKREDGKRLNWNKEWKNSDENKQLLKDIEAMNSERSKTAPPQESSQYEFASPVWSQTTMLTKRMWKNYWRDPSYIYGKLFTAVIVGIFNGFTFWQLGNSIQDMQNRMFTSFLILLIPPTVVNSVVPKFYMSRALWEFRELPSRTYGWFAFCTATVVCEIPIAIISALIYWLFWYYPTGLPTDSSTAGYVFLMTMLFFLFQASWGQWICAFAPSFTVISNVLPFFFVMFSLFNGVVRPYSQLSVFWRYWMYYVNPSTYWIGGVLAATLTGIPVQCAPSEAAYFDPPPGQTCQQYAGPFADMSPGYLINPSATSNCGYCQFSTGDDYLATLNVSPNDKWAYMGIFLGFCISNWALVYFFIYTTRIRGWSFGLGTLFNVVGGGLSSVTSVLSKVMPKRK